MTDLQGAIVVLGMTVLIFLIVLAWNAFKPKKEEKKNKQWTRGHFPIEEVETTDNNDFDLDIDLDD